MIDGRPGVRKLLLLVRLPDLQRVRLLKRDVIAAGTDFRMDEPFDINGGDLLSIHGIPHFEVRDLGIEILADQKSPAGPIHLYLGDGWAGERKRSFNVVVSRVTNDDGPLFDSGVMDAITAGAGLRALGCFRRRRKAVDAHKTADGCHSEGLSVRTESRVSGLGVGVDGKANLLFVAAGP